MTGKLLERDAFAVMDACDDLAVSLRKMKFAGGEIWTINNKFGKGEISKEHRDELVRNINAQIDVDNKEILARQAIGLGRVYYLGEKYVRVFNAFVDAFDRAERHYTGIQREDEAEMLREFFTRRGELQRLLTEKIIENWRLAGETKHE